jgi:hypothetical protein
MLNVIDEFSRECLATAPLRRFRSNDVVDVLPIWSSSRPSISAPVMIRDSSQMPSGWLGRLGVTTLTSSPGATGERLHRELQCPACDELLNGEIFYSVARFASSSAGGAITKPVLPAQQPRLPPSQPRNRHAGLATWFRCAPPPARAGVRRVHQLTIHPDQSSRAVRYRQ